MKFSRKISIYRVNKDYGPSTKLIPTLLREDEDTIIIVVDDDVIYGKQMSNKLVETYYSKSRKAAIITFGAWINSEFKIVKEKLPTYLRIRQGKYIDLIMGHNGFLITPSMFSTNIVDYYDSAPKECKWVDDIWISGWLKYNKVKIWSIGYQIGVIPITNFAELDSENSLCSVQNQDH